MRVKTPLGLFVAVVGVGLLPAAGLGSMMGVSLKDYHPIPRPSASAEVFQDMGESPLPMPTATNTGTRRVESLKPEGRTPTPVKHKVVEDNETPHARGSTNIARPEVTEESSEPVPSESPTPAPTLCKNVDSCPGPTPSEPPADEEQQAPVPGTS
jgi:hypothetical protein